MQKIYKNIRVYLGFAFLLLSSIPMLAQTDCQSSSSRKAYLSNGGISTGKVSQIGNQDNTIQLTIGGMVTGRTGAYDQENSIIYGFWSFYNLQPESPILDVSEGEFVDRIVLKWEVVDEKNSAPVTEPITKIYRNGELLTSVPVGQTSYLDFNVFPGEFYNYEVVTTNNLGDSEKISKVGFLNPNGRITGQVKSRSGVAVNDVKITLMPNLGRTLDLDGIDDYVYFDEKVFAINSTYTVEGWFRNIESKQQTLFSALDSGTTSPVITVSLDVDGKISYFHDANADGTGKTIISKDGYNLTSETREWHHFAAVHGATEMYLYIDGFRVGSTLDNATAFNNVTEVELGKDGKGIFDGYFNGNIDDFRIWNMEKERKDIRRFFEITLTGEEENLLAYWKFDEQFGEKIFDTAAKSDVADRLHGATCEALRSDVFTPPVQLGGYTDEGGDYILKGIYYSSGTTFAASASKETAIGVSLKFDGLDDYVSFEGNYLAVKDAFTLEGWFKTDSQQNGVIFDLSDSATNNPMFQLGLNAAGNVVFTSNLSGSSQQITSANAYNDEFWYHYAVSHDGSEMKLYVDAVLEGTQADVASYDFQANYIIGRANPTGTGSDYYNGRLDEMRFWNYARSGNQISGTMEQIMPVDELGIATTVGLEANWRFNEGSGDIVSDLTIYSHTGNLVNPQTETVNGEVIVQNWDGDDIPLDVEYFTHVFEPNARNVTLDISNVSVDRIDFTDISQLSVTGFVRFSNTNCFTDSVELFVNGQPTLPKTYSDKDGKFRLEFEPGTSNAFITYQKEDHTFAPNFLELPRLVRPIAGLRIDNTTGRTLKGLVAGGECELPIGTAKVIITTSPFCYTDTVDIDPASGAYEFNNVPPQNYIVFVKHDNPIIQSYFDLQGAAEVNLIAEDDSLSFIYKSALQTEITGFTANDCGKVIVKQYTKRDLTFAVYEEYLGQRCYLDSAGVVVNDDISDRDASTVEVTDGYGYYTVKAGNPNILDGGAFPYQKKIQIVAQDAEGRQADDVAYAYVTGKRPRSVDFATKTPEIPYLILRKPPGDQSISYLSESSTYSNSIGFSMESSSEAGVFTQIDLGLDVSVDVGTPFFTTELEIETTASVNASTTMGASLASSTEMTQEFTTSETISTVAGEGDLYVGGAMNILYGLTDVLSIDPNTCEISFGTDLLLIPDGFATTFVYSEPFIIGTVIPELILIGDTLSANNWKQIIMMNELLKEKAEFEENVSFDGGVEINRENTTVIEENFTIESNFFIETAIAIEAGIAVNGVGLSGGANAAMRIDMGGSNSTTTTNERTVGFTLADDDFGDNFSVNIKNDPVYGTPVFETVSGASSCPYEGTFASHTAGLSASVADAFLENIGDGLFLKQVAELDDNAARNDILNDITSSISSLGISGFSSPVTAGEAADAIDQIITTITGSPNHGTTVLDFYGATFDTPTLIDKNVKREAVILTVNRNIAIDIPEENQAIFLLSLGNLSETNEQGLYYLTALQETNPDGALITVNNVTLTGNNDIAFVLQPGEQIQVTLSVEKGATAFNYDDLQIMLYSACEKENSDGLGTFIPDEPFASIINISAHFIEVCSPISIFSPGQDWTISTESFNKMTLNITDYDKERAEFEFVRFQYRKKIEGEPFVNAIEIAKADLSPGNHILEWDVTNLDDGEYEIRAVSFCQGSIPSQISETLSGTIDRTPPNILGTAEPIDAVLGLGDEISITFNEDIICDNIISLAIPVSLIQGEANHIALDNSETGLSIEKMITCSGNKIVIVPDIQNKFIEGQVLRVDVLGLEDKYGNVQTEKITWEFIVQRNPLEWLGGDIDGIIMEGEAATFTRQVKNNGAFDVNYTMSGMLSIPELDDTLLPSWITASPLSGTIPPGGTETVTFTISDQIDGGFYDETVVASNSGGAPEMRFNLRVLCPSPSDWEIDISGYTYSMNLTSELIIDGNVSDDTYDVVAAFVGEEVRGIGNVSYVGALDRYEMFMTVYSNVSSGETIKFKVWDASTCTFYGGSEETYDFTANGIVGIPTSPVSVTAAVELFQKVPLAKGWNWFSVNLEADVNADINQFMGSLENPTSGDVLKNQTNFTQYVSSLGWVGTLTQLEINSMYQIKLDKTDTLEMLGSPIDVETTDISIAAGWNWISYLPQSGLTVDEALVSLSPITGDLIKSQGKFAQYVENVGWIGNLLFLNPNEGYLLFQENAGTLTYPFIENNGRRLKGEKRSKIKFPTDWELNKHDFAQTMNLTAIIDGNFIAEGDLVGIYENEELRGFGEARYVESLEKYFFFTTVYSNKVKEENLTLVYFNQANGKSYNLNETSTFGANKQSGTPLNPVFLTLPKDADLLLEEEGLGYELSQNFPNPFSNDTQIRYTLPTESKVEISVYNMLGQEVKALVSETQTKGRKSIKWNATDLQNRKVPTGIYFLRMRAGNYQHTVKMVLR